MKTNKTSIGVALLAAMLAAVLFVPAAQAGRAVRHKLVRVHRWHRHHQRHFHPHHHGQTVVSRQAARMGKPGLSR